MRTSDVDILIIPGSTGSEPDHWQSRWERSLSTARKITHGGRGDLGWAAWVAQIVEAVREAKRPVVLVAHSSGVAAVAHAAPLLARFGVAGAYLVAPADLEDAPAADATAMPLAPLPFPSIVVASSSDPHCTMERARELAGAWGATLVPAGDAGHINSASGHGPWPEGLMRFGLFLSKLDKAPPRLDS